MREKYRRCKISLLLLGLAICLAAKTDPRPAVPQQATNAVLCCATQSDKSAPEKSTVPGSKYYLDKLQFDSIKLELAGRQPFPLGANRPFTLRAASPSGPVAIRLVSSVQSGAEGIGSLTFTPQHPGQFVFEARVVRSKGPTAEPGVRLTLEVAGPDGPPPFPACAHLLPSAVELGLDAGSIVKLLGSPTPFTLEAQGDNAILIYSTPERLSKTESALLDRIEAKARELRRTPPEQLGIAPKSANSPFTVELAIPHAAALGDLASKIDGLHYAQFKVTDVGTGKVRINSDGPPSCEAWKGFLADVHDILWQLHSQPSSASLFYLTAADVTGALNATNLSQPPGSAMRAKSAPTASPAASSPAKETGTPLENASSGPAAKPSNEASPPTGSSSAAEPASPSPSAQKSPVAVAPLLTDRLVFGDTNPGDDELIAEKNRIIAALDLPRPEMIISAWILQNSSTDGTSGRKFQRYRSAHRCSEQRGAPDWRLERLAVFEG